MISIIISIIASIVSGMVLFFLQSYLKKKSRQDELNADKSHRMNVLIIKSINAIGDLTLANSIALRDGKTNGEMHKALDEYEKVNQEMLDFLIDNSTQKGE